jgi:hypothetical protein
VSRGLAYSMRRQQMPQGASQATRRMDSSKNCVRRANAGGVLRAVPIRSLFSHSLGP